MLQPRELLEVLAEALEELGLARHLVDDDPAAAPPKGNGVAVHDVGVLPVRLVGALLLEVRLDVLLKVGGPEDGRGARGEGLVERIRVPLDHVPEGRGLDAEVGGVHPELDEGNLHRAGDGLLPRDAPDALLVHERVVHPHVPDDHRVGLLLVIRQGRRSLTGFSSQMQFSLRKMRTGPIEAKAHLLQQLGGDPDLAPAAVGVTGHRAPRRTPRARPPGGPGGRPS
jgi:hypothetical protein